MTGHDAASAFIDTVTVLALIILALHVGGVYP